jgi:O-antigen ligase
LILGLALAEALFLGVGFALDQPLLGAVAAGALAYALLAYRNPDLGWALVWLAFPFSVELRIPGGNAIYAPTEPMIVLALLVWALRVLAREPLRIPRSDLHAPLAVLALVALLSVALSRYPTLGLKAWIAGVGYAAFGYLYCFLRCDDASRTERWVPWIVGSGALWGIYGTVRVLLQGISLQHAYGAARPFFTEHGTYGAYLAMIFPLGLLYAFERRGWARILYALASLMIGLGLVFSFTRAAWLSLVVVVPVTAALWAWWRRSLTPFAVLAGFAALVVLLLAGIGAGDRIARHAGSIGEKENASNLERLNRWMAAAEMTKDRPWFGVGYGAYPAAYPQYRRKAIITELTYQYMGAHSEPLRLLSETGFVGLLASLWFLASAAILGLRLFLRSRDDRVRLLALALLAGFGTYAIHGIFNSYLGIDKITIPFWAGLGVLAALGREFDPADGFPPGRTAGAGA